MATPLLACLEEVEVQEVANAKLLEVAQPRGPHVEKVVVCVLYAKRVAGGSGRRVRGGGGVTGLLLRKDRVDSLQVATPVPGP